MAMLIVTFVLLVKLFIF